MARNRNIMQEPIKCGSKCGSMNAAAADEQNEKIRKIAQQLFEKRGRQPGHELEDWLEAERMVKKC